PLGTIYEVIERYATLDAEDLQPDAPGSNSPRWKRNVRNVLQQRKEQGDILWDGHGHYRLAGSGDGHDPRAVDPWSAPATLQVRSWTLHPDIPRLIGRKKIDWSCFEIGTQVPVPFARRFFDVNGEVLQPGADRVCVL